MVLSKNKIKNNVYPCKLYIKGGFKGGSKLYRHVFVMAIGMQTLLLRELLLMMTYRFSSTTQKPKNKVNSELADVHLIQKSLYTLAGNL